MKVRPGIFHYVSGVLRNVFLLFLLFIVGSAEVSAQQEPQFTLNMFNHMSVNPGYAGLREAICVTGIMRQQWISIEDDEGTRVSPETFVVSGDSPIRILRGGVSLTVMQDKIGYFQDIYVKLGYAYHLNVGDGKLGIGLNAAFLNKSLDYGKFKPVDDDPITKGGSESTMFTDISLGAFYIQPGGLYLGLSSTQLLEGARELGTGHDFKLRRHYYGTVGYELSWLRNPAFVLVPSVFAKYDGTTAQVDLNARLIYNDKFWGGLSYRFQETAAVMVGMSMKDLSFGYAYDIPLSKIGGAGSHEIMLRYCFKLELEKSGRSFRNTRFL